MGAESYLVVGDAYRDLTEHAGVVTISHALRELRATSSPLHGSSLLVGQGIDWCLREELEAAARGAGTHVAPVGSPPLELTHKARPDCVLIATPVKIAERRYKTALVVGNAVDRLADHVTGHHLGGMLLTEAVRQLGIATVEMEYAVDGELPYGLAWGGLSARFLSYAFPVPTEITAQLTETSSRKNQLSVVVNFEVYQGGQAIAEMVMDSALMPKGTLKKLELRRAAQLIDKLREPRPDLRAEPAPEQREALAAAT